MVTIGEEITIEQWEGMAALANALPGLPGGPYRFIRRIHRFEGSAADEIPTELTDYKKVRTLRRGDYAVNTVKNTMADAHLAYRLTGDDQRVIGSWELAPDIVVVEIQSAVPGDRPAGSISYWVNGGQAYIQRDTGLDGYGTLQVEFNRLAIYLAHYNAALEQLNLYREAVTFKDSLLTPLNLDGLRRYYVEVPENETVIGEVRCHPIQFHYRAINETHDETVIEFVATRPGFLRGVLRVNTEYFLTVINPITLEPLTFYEVESSIEGYELIEVEPQTLLLVFNDVPFAGGEIRFRWARIPEVSEIGHTQRFRFTANPSDPPLYYWEPSASSGVDLGVHTDAYAQSVQAFHVADVPLSIEPQGVSNTLRPGSKNSQLKPVGVASSGLVISPFAYVGYGSAVGTLWPQDSTKYHPDNPFDRGIVRVSPWIYEMNPESITIPAPAASDSNPARPPLHLHWPVFRTKSNTDATEYMDIPTGLIRRIFASRMPVNGEMDAGGSLDMTLQLGTKIGGGFRRWFAEVTIPAGQFSVRKYFDPPILAYAPFSSGGFTMPTIHIQSSQPAAVFLDFSTDHDFPLRADHYNAIHAYMTLVSSLNLPA